MSHKCLIVYASRTGNTEKVALRFKSTFEKHAWECDSFKFDRKMVTNQLPFDFKEYDFVCVGSGVELHEPYHEIIACLRIPRYGFDPKSAVS
jgi:flavodoxin